MLQYGKYTPKTLPLTRGKHHLCMDLHGRSNGERERTNSSCAIMHTHCGAECNKMDILSTNLSIKITSGVIWDTEISTYAALKKLPCKWKYLCSWSCFFSFSNSTQIFIVTVMGCCVSSTHKFFWFCLLINLRSCWFLMLEKSATNPNILLTEVTSTKVTTGVKVINQTKPDLVRLFRHHPVKIQ